MKIDFAWDYHEMPRLKRDIVERKLSIKKGFRPHKQPLRHLALEVISKVEEEIERLLEARFIKMPRYLEWLSNIFLVKKKNRKLRACIDFRDLNTTTPKEKHQMMMADMLVDSTLGNEILSLMEGHLGYNQIFIA